MRRFTTTIRRLDRGAAGAIRSNLHTIGGSARGAFRLIIDYDAAMKYFLPTEPLQTQYPSVIHAWDNTPRSGVNGIVFQGASPERFRVALRKAFDLTREQKPDHRLVFLKSWNEWAEGNHLEPDLRDGHGFLKVIAEELRKESALCDNKVAIDEMQRHRSAV